MITGGSGSGDTGRPAKPDLGGRKQKIKSVKIQATKHPKPKLHSIRTL